MYCYGNYDFDCDCANSSQSKWDVNINDRIEKLCSSMYLKGDEDEHRG